MGRLSEYASHLVSISLLATTHSSSYENDHRFDLWFGSGDSSCVARELDDLIENLLPCGRTFANALKESFVICTQLPTDCFERSFGFLCEARSFMCSRFTQRTIDSLRRDCSHRSFPGIRATRSRKRRIRAKPGFCAAFTRPHVSKLRF